MATESHIYTQNPSRQMQTTARNGSGTSSNWKEEFLSVLTKHQISNVSYELFIKYFYRWNSLEEMEQQCKRVVANATKPVELKDELTQIFQSFLDYRNRWMHELEEAGVHRQKIRLSGILKRFAEGHSAVEFYCSSETLDKERELTAIEIASIRRVIAKNCSRKSDGGQSNNEQLQSPAESRRSIVANELEDSSELQNDRKGIENSNILTIDCKSKTHVLGDKFELDIINQTELHDESLEREPSTSANYEPEREQNGPISEVDHHNKKLNTQNNQILDKVDKDRSEQLHGDHASVEHRSEKFQINPPLDEIRGHYLDDNSPCVEVNFEEPGERNAQMKNLPRSLEPFSDETSSTAGASVEEPEERSVQLKDLLKPRKSFTYNRSSCAAFQVEEPSAQPTEDLTAEEPILDNFPLAEAYVVVESNAQQGEALHPQDPFLDKSSSFVEFIVEEPVGRREQWGDQVMPQESFSDENSSTTGVTIEETECNSQSAELLKTEELFSDMLSSYSGVSSEQELNAHSGNLRSAEPTVDDSSCSRGVEVEEPDECNVHSGDFLRPYDILMQRIILVLDSKISVHDEARAWLLENIPKMTRLKEIKKLDSLTVKQYEALKNELRNPHASYLEQPLLKLSKQPTPETALISKQGTSDRDREATNTFSETCGEANRFQEVMCQNMAPVLGYADPAIVPNLTGMLESSPPPDNDELERLRAENDQLHQQVVDANFAHAGLSERFQLLEKKNEVLIQEANSNKNRIDELSAQVEILSSAFTPSLLDVATNTADLMPSTSGCSSSSGPCRHIRQLQEEIECLRHDLLRPGSLLSRKSNMKRQSLLRTGSDDSSD